MGVDVIAPVAVAALVSRNDAVAVINTVNEHATCDGSANIDELLESKWYERGVDLLERIVAMLTKLIDP